MRTDLSLLQTNIIDADVKTEISWLFEIDRTGNGSVDDYWSTKTKTWAGQAYTFKVIDFSPIRMERGRSEYGLQSPTYFSFTLSNQSNTLFPSDFAGGNVTARLVVSADLAAHADPVDITLSTDTTDETSSIEEAEIFTWNFDIVNVSTSYQSLKFECRDWLRKYIEEAFWPNTPLIHHLWPTNEYGAYDFCVPVVFGTVYTPVPSAWISTDRFYIIGIDTPTYTITKARNPDNFGNKVEWLPADFAFNQSTKAADGVNYKALQVIAADANSDGVVDANVTFLDGEEFLPLSVKFSRDDLATTTNPADIIDYILKDFGIPTAKIDTVTQATAHATYDTWGLTFNAAFVKQESRETILARLLTMARMELIVRDKIYYKVHSKTSMADIEKEWVLDGSFNYWASVPSRSDCGYVVYPHVSGDVPVTSMNKALIAAKTTTAVKSSIEVEAFYVFNSQYAQRIGTLELQRQLLPNKTISFVAKGKSLALEVDDVITINPADYGAGTGKEYDVLIDSISISKDLSIDFSCTGFSAALNDWADLAPAAVTVGTDATLASYQPITAGPDSDPDATGTLPNCLPGRLRIGEGTSYILFDPATPLRISEYNAGTEIFRVGNLNGFLGYAAETYGLAMGEASKYLKYDAANGLRIAGAISASTIDIGGADATSFHIDIDGNMWLGAAAFNIATNPFAVSNAGVLGAVSGTIGGYTLSTTALYAGTTATRIQMDTGTGIHLGATAFADAPFRVSLAGALVATSATITGAINATSGKIGTATDYWNIGATGITAISAGTDVIINYGKTDFTNTDAGFILGYDFSATAAKFYIGSSTKYLNWDGTSITILGDIKTAASGERLEFLTADNKLHFYNSAGVEVVVIGEASTNPYAASIYAIDISARTATTAMIHGERGGTADTTSATAYNFGTAGKVTTTRSAGANQVINFGVYGYANGGQVNYGIYADINESSTTGGPLTMTASNSANAPSHAAMKGTLWVTSAGILYINTDGGTTWGKVGAQ